MPSGLNHLPDNGLNWTLGEAGEPDHCPEPLPVAGLLAECPALYQTTAAAS